MLLRRLFIFLACISAASAVRVAFIADTGIGNDNPSSSWVDYRGCVIYLILNKTCIFDIWRKKNSSPRLHHMMLTIGTYKARRIKSTAETVTITPDNRVNCTRERAMSWDWRKNLAQIWWVFFFLDFTKGWRVSFSLFFSQTDCTRWRLGLRVCAEDVGGISKRNRAW